MHMRNIPTIGALVLGLVLPAGPVLAQAAVTPSVPLGPNPSECEIQAALFGAAGPGCPPVVLKRPPPPPVAAAPAP
ncbi:OmpA family protein, partial [Azospirillum sp. C340-1]|nr:OmpA family protein [Azospirillum isscasi]